MAYAMGENGAAREAEVRHQWVGGAVRRPSDYSSGYLFAGSNPCSGAFPASSESWS